VEILDGIGNQDGPAARTFFGPLPDIDFKTAPHYFEAIVPKPPKGMPEDYARMRTHFAWAIQSMATGHVDIAQAKLVVGEWNEFVAKWLPQIKEAEVVAGIKKIDEVVKKMHQTLDRVHLEHLAKVVAARRDWFLSELLFKLGIAYANIVKDCPPKLLPGLLKIYRDSTGEEYEPTKDYRQSEAAAEQAEADFRRELARLECDWPERTSAAVSQRLVNLADAEFKTTDEELAKSLVQSL